MKERLTGAKAVVRVLKAAGIQHAFGIASGKMSPLINAIGEEGDWHYTGVRHEASAAFMATAVYAGTGVPALCLGETGPGGWNLASGLGGAWANNLAVVAITSSNHSSLLAPSRGAFSSTSNEDVFRPVTKWNATIRDVARIPEMLHAALRECLLGRPGPVHIDIPTEILAAEYEFFTAQIDAAPARYSAAAPASPDAGDVVRAASLLSSAERPLLIAGGGVIRACASDEFGQLLDRLPAVGMTTQMGLGAIPATHPKCIGQGGFIGGAAVVEALREADVVLAVGCRFSSFMWTDGPPVWAERLDQKLIQIDIDPCSMGQNLPLEIGLIGDAKHTLQALIEQMPLEDNSSSTWKDSMLSVASDHRERLKALADTEGKVMHPASLAREVSKFIRDEDLVTFDGGHTSFWSNDFTSANLPATRFHEPGMAHLGFGLPWALALSKACPDRRVFCITGDGAFGFTIQELDTARRNGLNVIVVVHNNEAWGVIRFAQEMKGFEFGTALNDTDYAAIARGFGCHGERISRVDEVLPALERAAAANLPTVIDARVLFEPHPMLPVFGKSTSPGK